MPFGCELVFPDQPGAAAEGSSAAAPAAADGQTDGGKGGKPKGKGGKAASKGSADSQAAEPEGPLSAATATRFIQQQLPRVIVMVRASLQDCPRNARMEHRCYVWGVPASV